MNILYISLLIELNCISITGMYPPPPPQCAALISWLLSCSVTHADFATMYISMYFEKITPYGLYQSTFVSLSL